ncbi:MAG: transposase [Clostridiales bacterium]|nr:transposase [Clostridiales bacterium]
MGTGAGGNFGNTKGKRSNATIHKGRQDKHIVGTNNYNQQKANGKNPSILTENPSELLKEGAGKGRMANSTKETVDFGRVIGKYYSRETGKYYNTTRGIIHYDSRGNAHIVPARPKGFK